MDTLCKALIFVPLFGGLGACSESPAPAPPPARSATAGNGVAAYPTLALGSGTGSARGLRDAADFVPDGKPVAIDPGAPRGGAFGVGIRPGQSASGIRP